jgi:hypothetical protein
MKTMVFMTGVSNAGPSKFSQLGKAYNFNGVIKEKKIFCVE